MKGWGEGGKTGVVFTGGGAIRLSHVNQIVDRRPIWDLNSTATLLCTSPRRLDLGLS